jgi:adenine-specific DNA-methyltransferase
MDYAPQGFRYPSTRYSGSKRRFLEWIWENVNDLEFDSVLDVFGGTGSVSLLFKRYGKKVLYNDLLKSNQIIGTAIIENDDVKVTEEDIANVLEFTQDGYPDFIQREFQGIFFTDDENLWLDRVIANISHVENQYKRAILMASLFQACLAKRPFNLFHRANLYLRLNEVPRTFGNKTTWERPFLELFKRYIAEYNRAVFSNNRENRVIGGFDAINSPNGVDLVYLDPPYLSKDPPRSTNYLAFYHFLEGLSDYKQWEENSDVLHGKTKRIPDNKAIQRFTKKDKALRSFTQLLERFQDSIIILSYQDEGIPAKAEICYILSGLGKSVEVFEKPHRYALSRQKKTELLFVAT